MVLKPEGHLPITLFPLILLHDGAEARRDTGHCQRRARTARSLLRGAGEAQPCQVSRSWWGGGEAGGAGGPLPSDQVRPPGQAGHAAPGVLSL